MELRTSELKSNLNVFGILNQSVLVLMGILIFFNPFPHTTSIKEISYYGSVLVVLALRGLKKTEISFNSPFTLWGGLFVSWSLIGLFFAINKENSIHDFYSHLIRYIILYYIIVNFFKEKKHLVVLSWIIIISGTVFSITGLCYFYFILENSLHTRFNVLGPHPVNVIGIITGAGILLATNHLFIEKHWYRKVLLAFCIIPMLGIIIAGQTRSVFIGLFLATMLYFWNDKKKLVLILAVGLMIVSMTSYRDRFFSETSLPYSASVPERIKIFNNIIMITIEIIKEHPIVGIGFGLETYRELDLEKYNNRLPKALQMEYLTGDPHNMLLDVGVRVGVVGLMLFCGILFIFIKMCWICIYKGKDDFIRNWGRCLASVFLLFFVIGFFQPVFSHVPEVILCIIFSAITILWRLNSEANSNSTKKV